MKILDELISTLTNDAKVKDIRQNPFQTAVLTRNCGLTSTPHTSHDFDPSKTTLRDWSHLIGNNAFEVAKMSLSHDQHEAAIGMGAINSLLDIDDKICVDLNAGELIAEKGQGKNVAIVGHFPFTPNLRKRVKELWIIELRPREGDLPANDAERIIPQADVVGITGTAFTNHTIERLLELCSQKAFVIILGGTTPLSPVLFNYGVDAVCGTKIVDAETVLDCISRGATYREIKGTRRLTMLNATK